MAYAANTGHVPWIAAVVLLANIYWAIAYDTEYAMVDRDDDEKIGIKTSAILSGAGSIFLCGPAARCGAGRIAILDDPGPFSRRLLPRVQSQQLGGRCGIRGRARRLQPAGILLSIARLSMVPVRMACWSMCFVTHLYGREVAHIVGTRLVSNSGNTFCGEKA